MSFTTFLLVFLLPFTSFMVHAGKTDTAINSIDVATKITQNKGDLSPEARKNAMTGELMMLAGVMGAIKFGTCAAACPPIPAAVEMGPATPYGAHPTPFCVPGSDQITCRLSNGALAALFAGGAIEGFSKMNANIKTANELSDGDAVPPAFQFPPGVCEGSDFCDQLMTAGSYNNQGSKACVGDANSVVACVALDDTEKPTFKVNGQEFTRKQLENVVNATANKTAVDKAKNQLQAQAESLIENPVELVEKDKDKSEKKNKKGTTSLAGDYESGSGFSPVPQLNYGKKKRKTSQDDPFNKHLKGLMAQFQQKKGNREPTTVSMGKEKIGAIQENIFMMAHRRYQKLRSREEFIEKTKKPFS